jgi:hypothetical protein
MAFPGTYNFNYYRGDTFQFIIKPKDNSGNEFSLVGYTAQFKVADKRGSTGTQYTGSAVINSVDNIVTCTVSPSLGRQLLPTTTYVYDVQIQDQSSTIYTLLTGTIVVTDDVTGAV